MLVVLTNSGDETATYLCNRISRDAADLQFVRIDTDRCQSDLSVSYDNGTPAIWSGNTMLRPSDITAIWYRRPSHIEITSSSDQGENVYMAGEWAEALEGFLAHVPREKWINYPACNASASHKIEQLTRARFFGLAVPKTLVTQDPASLLAFSDQLNNDIVVKPLASGLLRRGEAITLIYTSQVCVEDLAASELVKSCPTLFQERIDKLYDVRVTVVDTKLHATALMPKDSNRPPLDIRRDNMQGVDYRAITLPPDLIHTLIDLVISYQLRFAAIDLAISTDGKWVFFELNPNGQWAWLDLVGGQDIATSLISSFSGASS